MCVCDDNCVHYQMIDGRAIIVEKDDWFDYCTNESSDEVEGANDWERALKG